MRNAVVLVAVVVLAGCSSQPRFTHHGGDPEQMFDNKTAQDCWAGPVQKDDGVAASQNADDDEQKAQKKYDEVEAKDGEACYRALKKYPNGINAAGDRPIQCQEIDFLDKMLLLEQEKVVSAGSRASHLLQHPEEQKVIHVHNLPYCSELK